MIEALSAFHFERPFWLLALIPAVVFWLLERRSADVSTQWRDVIDPGLLQHLIEGEDRRSAIGVHDWLLAGLLLGIAAVAGPAWQREPSPFAEAKPPLAVVLKVTPSMLTPDLAPTRLERARQKLADILAQREGASTALIAYAGSAHIVIPGTPDSAVVVDLAKSLSPAIMPKEGDNLPAALALAEQTLASYAGGSILVLADTVGPQAQARPAPAHPVTVLALLPQGIEPAFGEVPGAYVIQTTPDQVDVEAAVHRLDAGDTAANVSGEGAQWREAGYWLVPVLALLTLLWFRRGWVLT